MHDYQSIGLIFLPIDHWFLFNMSIHFVTTLLRNAFYHIYLKIDKRVKELLYFCNKVETFIHNYIGNSR